MLLPGCEKDAGPSMRLESLLLKNSDQEKYQFDLTGADPVFVEECTVFLRGLEERSTWKDEERGHKIGDHTVLRTSDGAWRFAIQYQIVFLNGRMLKLTHADQERVRKLLDEYSD